MHTFTYEVHLQGPDGVRHVTMTQITTTLMDPAVQAARDHDMMAHLQGTMPTLGYTLLGVQKLETMGNDLPPNLVRQGSPWHQAQPASQPEAQESQAPEVSGMQQPLRLVGGRDVAAAVVLVGTPLLAGFRF